MPDDRPPVAPAPSQRHDQASPDRSGERGATTTEYLIVAGLMVLTIVNLMVYFRAELTTAVGLIGCKITGAVNGTGGSCGSGAASTAAGGRTQGGSPGGPVPSSGVLPPGVSTAGGGGVPGGRTAGGLMGIPGRRSPFDSGSQIPGFGTTGSLAGEAASYPGTVASVAGERIDALAAGDPGPGFTGTTARYGNWMGEGWSGGSEMPGKVGALPPTDALDALAQQHDFAYAAAEEAGRLYGEAEKNRLLALADENAYLAFLMLPRDPKDWVPRPKDLAAAARYRDRFPITMQYLARNHWRARDNAPPPTPAQAAALAAAGPMSAADLQAEATRRVQAWNVDRGRNMRARGEWK